MLREISRGVSDVLVQAGGTDTLSMTWQNTGGRSIRTVAFQQRGHAGLVAIRL